MKRLNSTTIFIIFLALLAALLGYNYFFTPFYNRFEQPEVMVEDDLGSTTLDVKQRVFSSLLVQEKISLLLAFPYTIQEVDAAESSSDSEQEATSSAETIWHSGNSQQSAIADFLPGIIILFGDKISASQASLEIAQLRELYSANTAPPLFAVDHEGGQVQRLAGDGFSVIPAWRELCQLTHADRTHLLMTSAQELKQTGINIILAPVVDAKSVVLGSRTCADQEQTLLAARNFIEVFGLHQIMPVIKHYPGLGNTTKDLHFAADLIESQPEETQLFHSLLEIYPTIGVMTAHVQIKDQYDDHPCSLSADCIHAVSQKHTETLIFSDALEMKSLEEFGKTASVSAELSATATNSATNSADVNNLNELKSVSKQAEMLEQLPETDLDGLAKISYLALMAGNDVLVYGAGVDPEQLLEIKQKLAELYEQDEQFAQRVDESALKVLSLKY